MGRKRDEAGTFKLLARLPQQFVALARVEYENAKREVISALKKASIGGIFLVVALFFLFWAIAALGAAGIAAIALALPTWAAALIVGGALILLTAVSVLVGILLLKRGNPVPEKTLARVGDDIVAASHVRYNADDSPALHAKHRKLQEDR